MKRKTREAVLEIAPPFPAFVRSPKRHSMMKQLDVMPSWPGRPVNESDSANAKKSEKPERRRRTTKNIKEEAFTGQKLKREQEKTNSFQNG
jgi:hypothetical protein